MTSSEFTQVLPCHQRGPNQWWLQWVGGSKSMIEERSIIIW